MKPTNGGRSTAAHSKLSSLREKHRRLLGWTLTEAAVALGLLGIGLSGIFVANSRVLTQLRSIKQTAAATQALQERIDQVRRATWNDLTSSAYLRDSVLNTASVAGGALPGLVEEIDVGAYPPPPGSRIKLQRLANGSLSVVSVSPNLGTQAKAVSVFVRLSWKGTTGTTRQRECATIIAKGGITKS
jgi:hypothetical protein